MAVVYRTSLKSTRMTAVVTDVGTSGLLKIGTAGMGTVLATIPLAATMGTVSGDTLTLSGVPITDTSADATGTAAEATITTAANAVVISGLTVGTSGANINLNSTAIQVGQEVRINSGTITHG